MSTHKLVGEGSNTNATYYAAPKLRIEQILKKHATFFFGKM
jgi:hypothetical protein